jgi:hypothetical protein
VRICTRSSRAIRAASLSRSISHRSTTPFMQVSASRATCSTGVIQVTSARVSHTG